MRVRYTARAYRDIADLITWIEAENPAAAGRVARRIEATISLLATMPTMGRPTTPELSDSVRQFPVRSYPYLIVYRITAETIDIITVFHTARDPDTKLR